MATTRPAPTILIVDDQPTNLKVLLRLFEEHHYKILIAENGERALQAALQQPDLILLDVMMPGMNGFETCRRLKANQATAEIPIIFMTALDNIVDKIEGFKAGAVDYITKPFQQSEVLARVGIHITLRRQQQELKETQEILLLQKALLEQMSITDDLTGLLNRRCLNTILKREFHRSTRHNVELSCLMFDLDHFKKINDVHGHDFGDVVLRQFADILKNSIRDTDFVFRFGGEEFLLLLPQTDVSGAAQTAEKILERTANTPFKTQHISTRVTVSIGVASVLKHHPPHSHNLTTFADIALYEAKRCGRNQVVIYEPSLNSEAD